ncbi:EAL and HDOD domain-containing protein [Propionivibrio dicarboxylicus]|uniref:EAL and HDOD domain-containing protein n=1 Tax=Propionivibrio dicarboxylicus TaxID=83767 RepID=UPI0015A45205|nr:HDOD domain-containing protein [Propionivibrio dicarboxylicus]
MADRSLKVAAIALYLDPEDDTGIQALVGTATFAALATALPCLITSDRASRLSPGTQERLIQLGCHIVADETIRSAATLDQIDLHAPCEWLGGHWFMAAGNNGTGGQSSSRGLELKLLQLVANEADTRDIEAVFRQDPVLSYHLLRLVNSIGIGVSRNISSFSQAILILGRQQLKRWLNLMLFSANRNDRRSALLLAHATVRARAMELLAKAAGFDRQTQEQAFMAGMFSLLGVLFAVPLEKILTPLNLNKPLMTALLTLQGDLGRMLKAIDAAEKCDAKTLTAEVASLGISLEDYNRLTVEAYQWMLDVIHEHQCDGNA